ncbi:type IV pilus twitching motility protein PilT [Enterococcus sp.]|uniref:type IV pilus twitching motility protein PilT n=1 Tax=Enterococcus sp. TaxID=35783 RepID=UPI00289A592E|nr:type IV pilus twitching motility protein PilT [Enterococcus sp.]
MEKEQKELVDNDSFQNWLKQQSEANEFIAIPEEKSVEFSNKSKQVPLVERKSQLVSKKNGHILLNQWLSNMNSNDASDLHLIENSPPIYRIHGDLLPIPEEEKMSDAQITEMAQFICTEKQWQKYLANGEVDCAYMIDQVGRFRVNIFRQMKTTSIAFRLIPTDIPELSSLGVPEILKNLTYRKQGLFLVTGPTGSGKSTTLAAMINFLNENKRCHILTLEDPVEFVHRHKKSIISQREIGRDTDSFANALKAALRQDPDVILVGEMRDFETIQIALTAAETGHIVFGTLHTSSAPATIERVVDVFPGIQQSQIRSQLASSLIGVLAQCLLPTADGNGRVVATEMMVNSKGIANIIRSGKTHQIANMLQMSRGEGMHTMQSSIERLVREHRVSPEIASLYLEEGSDQ